MPPHFGQRLAGHVVAVEVKIAVAAEGEVVVQPEVAELDLRPRPDVARQQADGHVVAARQLGQQFGDAGQDAAGRRARQRGRWRR